MHGLSRETHLTTRRQVQDLQSQIAELTQVNSQLRTKAFGKDDSTLERTEAKRRLSDELSGPSAVRHKVAAPVMRDFDHVRRNIQIYSQGLFDTPHTRASAPSKKDQACPKCHHGPISRIFPGRI